MLSRFLAILALAIATGCATAPGARTAALVSPSAPAFASLSPLASNSVVASSTLPLPPIGDVQPPPTGCVSMTFIAPGDDSRVVRRPNGRIDQVITPSGRREPVLARIEQDSVRELVGRINEAVTTGDRYALSHIPDSEGETMIPGPAAWEFLRRYLEPTDVVWSFGDSDTGLAVIRDNHLFCVVIVQRRTLQ